VQLAFHEAGHAVVAHFLGSEVWEISISSRDGRTFWGPRPQPVEVVALGAGFEAEFALLGRRTMRHFGGRDIPQRIDLLRQMNWLGDEPFAAVDKATQLIVRHASVWPCIVRVAFRLMADGHLTAHEFLDQVRDTEVIGYAAVFKL
jgi:hypothetical protein